jgi:hypothetical protein
MAILCSAATGLSSSGPQVVRYLWGKDLDVILRDVPHGNGVKYVPKSRVNDLELPYHEKALLIRNEYIFAFNQQETMSQDFEEVCGGVVVSA